MLISSGQIRGAPAIASLAALSIKSYLSLHPPYPSSKVVADDLLPICDYLQSSRPTAVNLSEAMNRIRQLLQSSAPDGASQPHANGNGKAEAEQLGESVKRLCGAVHEEDLERCRTMGRLGSRVVVGEKAGRELEWESGERIESVDSVQHGVAGDFCE